MEVLNKFGSIIGKVSDNEDPDKQGRVKVKLEFYGDSITTDWIPVLNMYNGALFLPEKNDMVLVSFPGDTDNCVVMGGIRTARLQPPVTGENAKSDLNKNGRNNLRFTRSKNGHQVIFDDTSGDEEQAVLVQAKNKSG